MYQKIQQILNIVNHELRFCINCDKKSDECIQCSPEHISVVRLAKQIKDIIERDKNYD